MAGDVVRAGRRHDRRLLDALIVEAGVIGAFPGEHHEWNARLHGDGKLRGGLSEPGSAGDGRDADPAGTFRVHCRRRAGAVLVPDVDAAHAALGQRRGPMHVAVAKQGEQHRRPFLAKGLRQSLVDLQAELPSVV